MPSKTIEDFAYKVRDYMRGAEVVEGKNLAYSQENNAVIATIENGKSYKVRWTGSATVTLKKNSTSGTEVTSGSTSPLSFTADSDFDLYFGSSADVTEIMVYDGNDTSDTYEPYYVPVKDSKLDIADQQVLGAWNELDNNAVTTTISPGTFTVNADKSVSVAVSSTPSGNVIFNLDDNATIKAGTRYLSGCPDIDSDDVFIQIYKSGVIDVKNKRGTEQEFTVASDITGATIRIVIGSGVSADKVDGKVFEPMISLEPNQPYVPHAMTNRELTEVVEHTLTPSSKLNVSNVKCISCGRIHSLTFLATATESIGQDELLFTGTIPYGSTPYYFFKTVYGDKMCEIQNGKIVLKSTAAANDVIRGSVTWIY